MRRVAGSKTIQRQSLKDKRGASVTFGRLRDALSASRELASNENGEALRGWRKRCSGEDLRFKIYALFSGIGYSRIDRSTLSAQHCGILDLAERFMELLEGQLWLEMAEAMDEAGLKPILADQMHISKKLDECENTIRQMRAEQQRTVQSELDRQDAADEEMFTLISSRIVQQHEDEARGPTPVFSQKLEMQMRKKRAVQSMIAKSRVISPEVDEGDEGSVD